MQDDDETESLRDKVVECLQTIFDPELPVNIYELGLIYRIDILPINNVQILMTLTAPGCPAAQTLPVEVDQKFVRLKV
jgi:metal-sulfur cluster biosynthetic enzyme